MRALALLLVIANLGLLGWETLIDPPPEPVFSDRADDTAPQLVLASERMPDAATQTPVRVAAKSESPPQQAPRCISVGPFQDLPTVTQAAAVLRSAGYDSRQRLEQGELWVGHWVSLSGFPTHEQAQRAIERLKGKGVTDAYLLPGVDPPNVISLGVFKEHERAQRRLGEAKALGFDATITDRTRAGSVYWVDVDLAEGKPALDTSLLAAQPGKIVRLETRPCS